MPISDHDKDDDDDDDGSALAGPIDGFLTFKLDNKAPVALDDLTISLNALAQFYEDYLAESGKALPEAGVKLYIHELRTGSVIAVLQAIAEQGQLVFGENGVVSTIQSAYEHADTIGGFMASLNDIIGFFLGSTESKVRPTKKQAGQMINFFEPVAKDNASQMSVQFNGTVNIGEIHYHYNSQQANAVQNSAKRYLGPSLPANEILTDELLILHQVRGDLKSKSGDKGIIESVSKSPVKLWFCSDEIKKEILDAADNPFQRVFVVDVEVKTADGKAALYKVLAVKDSFEKP
jgi:hypothetical protein